MPVMSYAAFLQALGWAALNSIWQAGFLWCLLWITNHLAKPSSQRRYILAVACIITSFLLFLFNIHFYLQNSDSLNLNVLPFNSIHLSPNWISAILSSAAIAYLLLLLFPIYQFYENWQHIKKLKRKAVLKVNIENRLFAQRMAKLLGITREVTLYFSEIIHSPVTLGFLKPIILLPIASLNQLSLHQAEAVLLHELAHIRRHDYLINILINITSTVLYFNPFVKLFGRIAEASREESCDQLVLQFGYDKISYASALLQLEKTSIQSQAFAIAATGKSHLFQRIEKIAGLPSPSSSIKFSHIAGILGLILFLFFFQALFITSRLKEEGRPFVFSNFANPYYFLASEEKTEESKYNDQNFTKVLTVKKISQKHEVLVASEPSFVATPPLPSEAEIPRHIIPVALNEMDAKLTFAEKKQVESTIVLVKEVLITTEWKNLKKEIPDGLTEEEKNAAYSEYLAEVKKINWENLELNLKTEYNNINWNQLEVSLQKKLEQYLHDSLSCENQKENLEAVQLDHETHINQILSTQDKTLQMEKLKEQKLMHRQDSIKAARKKVIKL